MLKPLHGVKATEKLVAEDQAVFPAMEVRMHGKIADRGFFLLFILLVIAVSCSEKGNHYTGFPETVSVVTRKTGFDTVYVRYPYRIRLVDSSLYMMDLHGGDYHCHEFAYPSMKLKKSFAKKGKGVNEVPSVSNMAVNSEGNLFILSGYGRKIYTYDRDNGLIKPIVELSDDILYYPDFVLYNDSTFIIPDFYGKCRLFVTDHHGKIIRQLGVIPDKDKNIPDALLGQAWRPFIGYNPHNGIVAVVTQFGEVIEIYDLFNDKYILKTGPGGEPKCKYKGSEAYPIGIMGYGDVYVGEKYIYALFWGWEYEKLPQGKITYQGGNYIHVFDLEGNPVRRYEIDRHITGLFVDETRGEVLGTDVNEEELISFDL